MRGALLILLSAAFILGVGLYGVVSAQSDDNEKLRAADAALWTAAQNFKEGQFKQAGEAVKEAQQHISSLDNASRLRQQVEPLLGRLKRAHALLEIEGVKLPPLEAPSTTTPRKAKATTIAKGAATAKSDPSTTGVSFVKHVAPILVSNCFDCHGEAGQNSGRLSLATFSGLRRGGQNGVAIVAGKSADSLLVRKLRGMAGARMPLRRDPLSESDIATIEKWINEGAKYDSQNEAEAVDDVVAQARVNESTHEQLSAERAELAKKNWRMALTDVEPATHQTANFLLIGNVAEETLASIGKVAEQQTKVVGKMLRASDDEPLVKGRVTLFIFKRRADYSEWRMVENREIPPAFRGHWKHTGLDAYGCIVPPGGAEFSLEAMLAEQIAGLHAAGGARTPTWFAEGVGRLIASRVDSRDARVRDWDNQYPAAVSTNWKIDDFLAGNLPTEQQGLVSYAVAKSLAGNSQRFFGLMSTLRKGQPFEAAFARIYGQTPKDVLAAAMPRSATWRPYGRRGQ